MAEETGPQLVTTPPVNDGVRAFDQNGREVIVPREEWRENVLPAMIKESWDQPEQLYMLILNSLNDGFVTEMTEAAAHLLEIDPMPARGACTLAIVYLASNQTDAAEQVLERQLKAHGEDGSVLINLAKVFAQRGEMERRDATLWRGLELEPNQENGLAWFASIAQETGGEEAANAALERVRALDGSWRAQLWLARAALVGGNLEQAKDLYAEALERAPRPVPADFLMQMSGDLGTQGLLNELIALTGPFYVPEMHGLPVGNNLIKANVDTGNLVEAIRIKNELKGFNRPDWAQALGYWDGEIAKRGGGEPETGIQIGMLRVDGPIWLPPGSPARAAFGTKAAGPTVTFLGGTAESPEGSEQAGPQLAEVLGRMTRALPLYLAEQVEMRTAAQGRALIPWAVGNGSTQPSGFIVSGARWPDETAMQAVQDPANQSDYVVTVHVDAEVEPWEASLVFVRSSDGQRIGELQADFAPEHPEDALPGLADEVVELLSAMGSTETPPAYEIPEGMAFGAYMSRLEQLLAVRCAAMDGVSPQFLHGEREILDGNLALCMAEPASVPTRVLLVETMGAMLRVKPQAVEAFQETFARLQREKPLPQLDALFTATPV